MLRRSQVKKVYQQRRLSCGALSHESSSKRNQAFHKPETLLAGWLKARLDALCSLSPAAACAAPWFPAPADVPGSGVLRTLGLGAASLGLWPAFLSGCRFPSGSWLTESWVSSSTLFSSSLGFPARK